MFVVARFLSLCPLPHFLIVGGFSVDSEWVRPLRDNFLRSKGAGGHPWRLIEDPLRIIADLGYPFLEPGAIILEAVCNFCLEMLFQLRRGRFLIDLGLFLLRCGRPF